jgi:hypothetical protein
MFKYLLIVILMGESHTIKFRNFDSLNNCKIVKENVDKTAYTNYYGQIAKTSCVKIKIEPENK